MDCQEFKRWLIDRDDCSEKKAQQAHTHRARCTDCDRLHSADEALERTMVDGFHSADVPGGMARRARALTEVVEPTPATAWTAGWRKVLVPSMALGVLVAFLIWNPRATPLITLDAIGTYALANHNRADMTMAFTADEISDPKEWFYQRLDFRFAMPNLSQRQLTFLGGRECTLGPKKAAYLFYDDNGERISVFIIPARHIEGPLQADRRYRIDMPHHRVELWKMDAMICILVQDLTTRRSTTT
ncbi:MAG: hypothetical protein QNJ04_05280 [Desulfobacterales bacterium]|nr:hypothetical protein [Desulfobacterales bacterium]